MRRKLLNLVLTATMTGALVFSVPSATETVQAANTVSQSEGAADLSEDQAQNTQDVFSSEDSHGNAIHPFQSSDGTFYLFLTNDMDLSHTAVKTKDSYVSASAGTYDASSKTLTINASENVTVTFTKTDGSRTQLSLMHSDLPSVYLKLNNTTLDEIHSDKDVKHKGNSVFINDPSSSGNDLDQEDSVEVKGRGNSSWKEYEKKGYQIKFDKKQSVLGMGKAKKWTLISDSSDPTLLKNDTAYYLANQMGFSYAPDSKKADLWIDGEYRGTYSIIEKVEIGESRQNLSDNGVIAEFDNSFFKDEEYFVDSMGSHLCLKDPDIEDAGTNWTKFQTDWNAMLSDLDSENWSKVENDIDPDSFAKYYILEEYLANDESCTTSRYFYQDGGKIYAGPVWDFDTCMDSYENLPAYYWAESDKIYSRLLKYADFSNLVTKYYNQYKDILKTAASYLSGQAASIQSSADMNYVRWPILGTTDAKGKQFLNTYSANVNRTASWLNQRSETFTVPIPVENVGVIPEGSEGPVTVRMFRLYNPNSGEHFYTGSSAESEAVKRAGWNFEGTAWYAPSYGSPVYRMYNPNAGDHHYTMVKAERDWLVSLGWNYEGIGWKSAGTSGTPVYRLYNPNAKTGTHHYTENAAERDHLVSLGWRYEGIGWYAVKTN